MVQFLAFFAASVLALPSGWCCWPQAAASDAPPKCPACAEHATQDSQPAESPANGCDCGQRLLTPSLTARAEVPPLVAVLPIATVELPALFFAPAGAAISVLPDPGVPIRVLQCVLRL